MKKIILLLSCLLSAFAAISQDSLYVSTTGNDNNTGTSWSSAFRNIHKALYTANQSTAGSVSIFVAGGMYKPTEGTSDPNDRDTFFLFSRYSAPSSDRTLRVYGGYNAATGARDIDLYTTYLDGNIGNPDSLDNSNHVAVITGLSADTLLLDGFTIQNGFSYPGPSSDKSIPGMGISVMSGNGAGLYVAGDYMGEYLNNMNQVTVSHCRLLNNQAYGSSSFSLSRGGGGLCIIGASPSIENCSFLKNSAVYDNSFVNSGGAILTTYSCARIKGCTFEENYGERGGGLFSFIGDVHLEYSFFFNNAAVTGGTLCLRGNKIRVTGCVFELNYATNGGLEHYNVFNGDTLNVSNCLYVFNQCSWGVCSATGDGVVNLDNNTYFNNHTLSGAILRMIVTDGFTGKMRLSNSILWRNVDGGLSPAQDTSVLQVNHCDANVATIGTGNLDVYPRFTDTSNLKGSDGIWGTADDGLHLLDSSQCLNAGDNNAIPVSITTDLAGGPRILQGQVDMGAYEGFASNSVGIGEHSYHPAFDLYPNPAHSSFSLACTDLSSSMRSVQLSDVTGRTVLYFNDSKALTRGNVSIALPAGLPPGSYFVAVQFSNGYTAIKKLVKD